MAAVRCALCAILVVAAVSALPVGNHQGNAENDMDRGAISIALFSGSARTMRDTTTGTGRPRRQMDEDFSGESDVLFRTRRSQPGQHEQPVESPFGQTSDVEDQLRFRRADQDLPDDGVSEEGVFHDFPVSNPGVRAGRYAQHGDVYSDLADELLPFGLRTVRQVPTDMDALEQVMLGDNDEPDYVRRRRQEVVTTEAAVEATTATEASVDEEGTEGDDKVSGVQRTTLGLAGSSLPTPASDKYDVDGTTTRAKGSTDADIARASSLAAAASTSTTITLHDLTPRRRRSPQRQDGFVLSDFSGYRRGRSLRRRRSEPSEAEVHKMLLVAPIDEAILGELPVRRTRQAGQPDQSEPAGGPKNYLVPLVPDQAATDGSDSSGASSTPGKKLIQIYTVRSPDPLAQSQAPATPGDAGSAPAALPVIAEVSPSTAETVSAQVIPVVAKVSPPAAAPGDTVSAPAAIAAQVIPVVGEVPASTGGPAAAPILQISALPAMPVAPVLVPQSLASNFLSSLADVHVDVATPEEQPNQQDVPNINQPLIVTAAAPAAPANQVQMNLGAASSPTQGSSQGVAQIIPLAQVVSQGVPEAPERDPHAAAVVDPSVMSVPTAPATQQGSALADKQAESVEAFLSSPPRAPSFPPPRQEFDVGPPCAERTNAFVPVVEKSISVQPDGSYMYRYETADGVRVAETGTLKEVPAMAAALPEGAQDPNVPSTRLANSVSGGYSYTAPDGTFFSLRYVADENGFRPIVGGELPAPPQQ